MKKFHLRNKNKLGGPGILQIAVNLKKKNFKYFLSGLRIQSGLIRIISIRISRKKKSGLIRMDPDTDRNTNLMSHNGYTLYIGVFS
jgi:hypothetical protein